KPIEETKSATANGTTAESTSNTNGVAATASPPKSPSLPTADTSAQPAVASEEAKPSNRTKIGGEGAAASADFKVPDLPTPTESRSERATNGETTMTKVQHKFLSKSIQSLKRMHDSRFYREPVDPIKLNVPHYPQFIKRPMDLGTIEKKLKNNVYRTAQAVIDDFNLMVQNALTFNGPDHLVAQEGQKLKITFDKQMANLPRADEVEEKKPKKSVAKPSTAIRLPLIRRDSANADGRPKRSIHPPKRDLPYSTKPKKKKYQWELRFCQEVLDELHKPKHYTYAMPFYHPVDPVALNIPTYHSIIKKPMDFSTVQSKLRAGQYENAKEFELDMRLILKNCFKFNIPGDPTYMAGQRLEEEFNKKWAQKTRYLEQHEPHVEHHSAESSEEESEEDAEESDYDAEKLSLLQKQMEEMTRQIEAITKKKKTPPGSKKLGKTKPGKKESKKPSTMGLAKKESKKSTTKVSAKPEKQHWVTYHEKQIISNGISSLPDKKMQEALKIIQTNVPALKGTQEAEIELDIDELPNDVLLML
ncbi:hypothetical protein ASPNIDRAFT_139507, partial [Aspergillus niger ATCC 1015]